MQMYMYVMYCVPCMYACAMPATAQTDHCGETGSLYVKIVFQDMGLVPTLRKNTRFLLVNDLGRANQPARQVVLSGSNREV
jgi:hypothetical protein